MGLADSEEGLSINFPIGPNDSVQSISDKMIKLVSGFQLQDVLYGKRDISEAPDLVRKILGVDMPEEEIYETLEVLGFYVDRENGVIWNSEELAIKHEKFVREKEQSGVSFQ